MKIQHKQYFLKRDAGAPKSMRAGERGMATIIFIALLAIMMVLLMSNARTVLHLSTAEKIIEQKQIERLNAAQTNATAVAESPAKPDPK